MPRGPNGGKRPADMVKAAHKVFQLAIGEDSDDKPKAQMGSLEGELIGVRFRYRKPAIRVRERKTGNEIWGIIGEGRVVEIVNAADFNDVWIGKRVLLRGKIHYSENGQAARIFVKDLERVEPRNISVAEIQDGEFTGGLTAAEYLGKFRNGDLV